MNIKEMSVSFVLPMFNEAENIADTIGRVGKFAGQICGSYEIVISDDASTDGSADIVKDLAAGDSRIKLVALKKNSKFGGALNAGLMAASKEIVVYTDSDLPAKEEDIKKAIELLDDTDIVTAYSLVIKDASFKRIVMSKVYNFLVQVLFGLHLRDINSGLKVYRRKILEGMKLKSESPFIDVEIFAEALKRGARIHQYGLVFDLRLKGNSHISRPSVIARTLRDMLTYKFSR